MGLDNYTKIVYGWKVSDEEVQQIDKELNDICEDKYNKDIYDMGLDSCIVEDTMCGNYLYYGAILGSYDADEGGEVIINSKLVNKATSEYNNIMKLYPEIEKVFKKYSKNEEPQLYVFQCIW